MDEQEPDVLQELTCHLDEIAVVGSCFSVFREELYPNPSLKIGSHEPVGLPLSQPNAE